MKNDPTRKKARVCRSFINSRKIYEIERILKNEGLEGWALTWQQLRFKARLDVSEAIIWRTMGKMEYLACQRGWQSLKSATNQVKYAKVILERHSEPEDWDCKHFSDELHFGCGSQHQLQILRKPKEQYCIDCI